MEKTNKNRNSESFDILRDSEDFSEYRLLMIEEADFILSNKKEYIQQSFLPDEIKIIRICALIDFFILEDEDSIVDDLLKLEEVIRLKKFINLGYL